MVNLADVVAVIVPDKDRSGALQVCSDQALVVTSRTYNQLSGDDPCLPGGTLGQRLDGARSDAGLAAGGSAVLPHMVENDVYRSNLGLVNAGDTDGSVEVSLFDGTGSVVATYSVELAAGEWWQDNRPFAARAELDDLPSGWARITVIQGSGVFAYASVIDNTTNDPSTVAMRR
jgi:hypothetical protein